MSIATMQRPDALPSATEREFSPETDAARTPEQMRLMVEHSVQREQAEARARLQRRTSPNF